MDLPLQVPFHRHGVDGTMKFWVLGQPLHVEYLVLLLEGFHAALEMNFQPLAAANREKLHALRHVAALINSANNVSESIVAASAEINLGTGHAVVVGNVAGAEPEFADTVVDGCLLKGIGNLVLYKHGLNDPFHIFSPKHWHPATL